MSASPHRSRTPGLRLARRSVRRTAAALLIGGATWLQALHGAAADPAEEASKHFRRGVELYKADDFDGAVAEFRRADGIQHNYRVLYNLGKALVGLQRWSEAKQAFERYLREGANQIDSARRGEVEAELGKLRGRVAHLTIIAPAGAELLVDDVPLGVTPFAEPVEVSVGRRRVRLVRGGVTVAERAFEFAVGDTLALEEPRPKPAPAPTPAPRVPSPSKRSAPATPPSAPPPTKSALPMVLGWTGTGVLAVATVLTGVLARGKADALAEELGKVPADRARAESLSDDGKTLALTSDVLLPLTLIGAGVSTWLTIRWASPTPQAASSGRPTAAYRGTTLELRAQGTGLSFGGSF